MTKIDLGNLEPGSIYGQRGAFVIRWTKNGPRAQAWPKPGAFKNARGAAWWREQFGVAARMAANPNPIDAATAVQAALGTLQVPRDHLTAAAYGNLYRIVGPDGVPWTTTDKGEPAPPPPPEPIGELTMWEWSLWDDAYGTSNNTTGACTKGVKLRSLRPVTIYAVRAILNQVSTTIYRASIVALDGSNVITEVYSQADTTSTLAGRWPLEFGSPAVIPANQSFAVLFSVPAASPTFVFPFAQSNAGHWLYPWEDLHRVTLAQSDPMVGQTVTQVTGGTFPVGLLMPPTE